MNQIAFILKNTTIYWHPVIVTLAVLAGICFFMACCHHAKIEARWAACTVLLGTILSLLFSRLLYWYSRPDSFESLMKAVTTASSGSHALVGVFFGCTLAVLVVGKYTGTLSKLADCMSVAGCGAIALGRLSNFFTSADRGQILTEMVSLPWAYPVVNPASGLPDYRLATFMLQAMVAGVLFLVLGYLFFHKKRYPLAHGEIAYLFFLVYCTSQIILDSTRYDSLYFRSNGFVSIVMVLSAVVLGVCIVIAAVRAAKAQGIQKWMIALWIIIACLVGLAGYMEYYVQRHGKLAFFSYSIMEHCLVGIVVLTLCLWKTTLRQCKPLEQEQPEPVYAPPATEELPVESEESKPKKRELKMAQLKMPELKLPELKMPELKLPELKMPEIKLPEVKMPEPKQFVPKEPKRKKAEPNKTETHKFQQKTTEPEKTEIKEDALLPPELQEFYQEDFDWENLDLEALGIDASDFTKDFDLS